MHSVLMHPVGQNYTRNFPKGGRIAGKIDWSALSPVAVGVERGAAAECPRYTSRERTCSTVMENERDTK